MIAKCARCHSRDPIEGLTICQACGDSAAIKRKECKRIAIESGMCHWCYKFPQEPGRNGCKACLERACRYAKERLIRNRPIGLCACGRGPAREGKAQCQVCATASRNSTRRRAKDLSQKKLCVQCGNKPPKSGLKNCEDCLSVKSKYGRQYKHEAKIAAFNAYGGCRCVCCGEESVVFLTIDHIKGGGNKHRREVLGGKGGFVMYQWLKLNNYPAGYRVLCFNCNFAEAHGGCPHVTERLLALEAMMPRYN